MKKFLVFILAILFAMPVMVQAQNKELEKQLKKEYKQKLKQLKKEGWQIYGTSRSLEVSLLLHYQKLNDDGSQELLGTASNCVSMNVCRQMALQNACAYYASLAGSKLKGRIVSDLAANASGDLSAEFDKFYAAYERLVEKEIKGLRTHPLQRRTSSVMPPACHLPQRGKAGLPGPPFWGGGPKGG